MGPGPASNLPPGHELGAPAYWRITVCMFLAGLVTFAPLYGVQPLLPILAAEFGVTPARSTLAVSAATLGIGAALLVVGPLSEVIGRRVLMLGSLSAAAVTGVACGLAPSFEWLLVARAAQGVALSGLPAVAVAYLSEELAPRAQARAAGLYIGGTALGGMSGRLLVGGLAEIADWRVGLVVLGVGSAIGASALAVLLPASRRFVPAPRGPRALARTTGALLTDRAMVGLFAVAATGMGAFVAVFNAIAFRLTQPPYSLSSGTLGLVYLVYLSGSASSMLAGRAVARHGQRAVAPWGAAIMTLGALITLAQPLPLVIVGIGTITVGFFALHAVASGWVAARALAGAGAPGTASSLYLVSYYAGASGFGTLAGTAWSAFGWPAVATLCAGLSLVAFTLVLLVRRVPPIVSGGRRNPRAGERPVGSGGCRCALDEVRPHGPR
ncbi:MAG: MFS transporter [Austwickia sp.]|nr:MFS transporter [Austwickia sp.]MBK8436726.1 MFS transporter [Austwickia sp.]MBK9100356.1 MFS transporter [Austwickia sp.]